MVINRAATFEKIGKVDRIVKRKHSKHLQVQISTDMLVDDLSLTENVIMLVDSKDNKVIGYLYGVSVTTSGLFLKIKPFVSVADVDLDKKVTAYKVDLLGNRAKSELWKDYILFLALFIMLFFIAALLFYGLADII